MLGTGPVVWRHKCENVDQPKRIRPLQDEEGKLKASHQKKCPVISWWKLNGGKQRVLNDLWTTRLSCGRLIRLLVHPLPHPPFRCISFSVFLRITYWRREWEWSHIIQRWENLVIYKSSNTLWWEGYWVGVQLWLRPYRDSLAVYIHDSVQYKQTST